MKAVVSLAYFFPTSVELVVVPQRLLYDPNRSLWLISLPSPIVDSYPDASLSIPVGSASFKSKLVNLDQTTHFVSMLLPLPALLLASNLMKTRVGRLSFI